MQKLPIEISAEWDPEASVWVATSEDIDGFVSRQSANAMLKQAGLPKAF